LPYRLAEHRGTERGPDKIIHGKLPAVIAEDFPTAVLQVAGKKLARTTKQIGRSRLV